MDEEAGLVPSSMGDRSAIPFDSSRSIVSGLRSLLRSILETQKDASQIATEDLERGISVSVTIKVVVGVFPLPRH